jgi:hypothetical protein
MDNEGEEVMIDELKGDAASDRPTPAVRIAVHQLRGANLVC